MRSVNHGQRQSEDVKEANSENITVLIEQPDEIVVTRKRYRDRGSVAKEAHRDEGIVDHPLKHELSAPLRNVIDTVAAKTSTD